MRNRHGSARRQARSQPATSPAQTGMRGKQGSTREGGRRGFAPPRTGNVFPVLPQHGPPISTITPLRSPAVSPRYADQRPHPPLPTRSLPPPFGTLRKATRPNRARRHRPRRRVGAARAGSSFRLRPDQPPQSRRYRPGHGTRGNGYALQVSDPGSIITGIKVTGMVEP